MKKNLKIKLDGGEILYEIRTTNTDDSDPNSYVIPPTPHSGKEEIEYLFENNATHRLMFLGKGRAGAELSVVIEDAHVDESLVVDDNHTLLDYVTFTLV